MLWNDEGTLVVGDAAGKHLWAFRIEPDGSLSSKDRYYTLRVPAGQKESAVAGLVEDDKNRLYAAAATGVHVYDPTGRLCGVLLRPEAPPTTVVALGGIARGLIQKLDAIGAESRATNASTSLGSRRLLAQPGYSPSRMRLNHRT